MWKNFLRNNSFAFFLAIFLAVILWLFVSGDTIIRQVSEKRDFHDVSLVPLLGENMAVSGMPDTVSLTLEGPPHYFANLLADDLIAFVDVKEKRPGTYQIPVKSFSPRGLTVVSFSPSVVEVIIEEIENRKLAINIELLGQPDPAFRISAYCTPGEVTVQGPASLLNKIDQVVVLVDVRKSQFSEEIRVRPHVVDRSGKEIDGITLFPQEVILTLELVFTEQEA